MKLTRCSPLVAAAFLAAHLAACACTMSIAATHSGSTPKPTSHACCPEESHPAPQPATPAQSSCCCDDASHLAILEEPAVPEPLPMAAAPLVQYPMFAGREIHRHVFDGSPPGRAPDVPLYTLHASLLI